MQMLSLGYKCWLYKSEKKENFTFRNNVSTKHRIRALLYQVYNQSPTTTSYKILLRLSYIAKGEQFTHVFKYGLP